MGKRHEKTISEAALGNVLTNLLPRNRIGREMKKERNTPLPGSFKKEPTEILSGLGMYKGEDAGGV